MGHGLTPRPPPPHLLTVPSGHPPGPRARNPTHQETIRNRGRMCTKTRCLLSQPGGARKELLFQHTIMLALVVLAESVDTIPQTMINISIGYTSPQQQTVVLTWLQAISTTLFSKFNKINDRKLVKTSIGLSGLRITSTIGEKLFLFTLLSDKLMGK